MMFSAQTMENVFVTKAILVTPTLLVPTICVEALTVMTQQFAIHQMANANVVRVMLSLMACV